MKTQNSELIVDFEEYQMVLDRILSLFLVGVIFPMFFLLTWSPDWWITFSNPEMTLIELLFLAALLYHIVNLFNTVRNLVDLSTSF